jgi:hypothetical protein
MYFVERILRHGQHSHIRTEFLNESFNYSLTCGIGRYSNTLGGDFLPRILEVEPHHTVEQKILRRKQRGKYVSLLRISIKILNNILKTKDLLGRFLEKEKVWQNHLHIIRGLIFLLYHRP